MTFAEVEELIYRPRAQNTRLRQQLAEIHGLDCHWCGCRLHIDWDRRYETDIEFATIEHLVPRFVGGSDFIDNLRLACGHCNERRPNPAAMLGNGVFIPSSKGPRMPAPPEAEPSADWWVKAGPDGAPRRHRMSHDMVLALKDVRRKQHEAQMAVAAAKRARKVELDRRAKLRDPVQLAAHILVNNGSLGMDELAVLAVPKPPPEHGSNLTLLGKKKFNKHGALIKRRGSHKKHPGACGKRKKPIKVEQRKNVLRW